MSDALDDKNGEGLDWSLPARLRRVATTLGDAMHNEAADRIEQLERELYGAKIDEFRRSLDEEHAWAPDGDELRFESHPGCEVPHVHTTCKKCGARAWFTEQQWGLLSMGCSTPSHALRDDERPSGA